MFFLILVISVITGSGKTFLVSFDAKRLLYIVHRDAILTAARESFVKVFAGERSCVYDLKANDK